MPCVASDPQIRASVYGRKDTKALVSLLLLAEAAFAPAIGFLLIPIIIKQFGVVDYGHFALVQAIGVLGASVSMGLGTAITRYVGERSKLGDRSEEPLVRAAAVLLCLVTAFLWASGWWLATQLAHLFHLTDDGRLTLFIALVWTSLQLWENFFGYVLKGYEKFLLASSLDLVGKTIAYGIFIIALFNVGEFNSALVLLVAASSASIGIKFIGIKSLGQRSKLSPRFDRKSVGQIATFSLGIWLQGAASLAFNSIDKFLVAATMGPVGLATYNVAVQIAALVHFVPATVLYILIPGMSSTHGSNYAPNAQREFRRAIAQVFRKNMYASLGFAIAIGVIGTAAVAVFPSLFGGALDVPLLIIMLIAYYLVAVAIPWNYALVIRARTRAIGAANVAAAVFAVLVMLWPLALGSLHGVAWVRVLYGTILGGVLWSLFSQNLAATRAPTT